jgi:hypothetical protein
VKTLYKAKTLSGAEREVRALRKRIKELDAVIGRYMREAETLKRERALMAKLAADGSAFDNPIVVAAAQEIRNRILREDCRMNPDGTPAVAASSPRHAGAGERGGRE